MATARVSATISPPVKQAVRAIILFGSPGAGKGTQARKITARYRIPRISTGDIIREEVGSGSSLGKKVEATLAAGRLVDDETVNQLVKARLDSKDCRKGFLLDGYPRTACQARALQSVLDRMPCRPVIIEVQVGYNETVRRITGRRLCAQCGAIYNVCSHPPKVPDVCDGCGHRPLSIRSDDRAEVIEKRFYLYQEETVPVYEVFRSAGEKIHQVDGTQSEQVVCAQIFEILETEGSHDHP
ncbi:MAG: nucleoside monophosphate kinase [Bryobacterales bacterium]|nr:nucleoside monophosphate kinase [Bryobacterales bacterium]